jgi:hypothetical protein
LRFLHGQRTTFSAKRLPLWGFFLGWSEMRLSGQSWGKPTTGRFGGGSAGGRELPSPTRPVLQGIESHFLRQRSPSAPHWPIRPAVSRAALWFYPARRLAGATPVVAAFSCLFAYAHCEIGAEGGMMPRQMFWKQNARVVAPRPAFGCAFADGVRNFSIRGAPS